MVLERKTERDINREKEKQTDTDTHKRSETYTYTDGGKKDQRQK